MGARAGTGGVCVGSCQGLGVGLGDCPPQECGGVPSVPDVLSSVLFLVGPGVPLPWGWGWGTRHWVGWLSAHPLGQCLSDCVSGSKEQVTLEALGAGSSLAEQPLHPGRRALGLC